MNTLSSAYSIALTGLSAADRRLGVSANNVANVNSSGFEPSSTGSAELRAGGVKVSISEAARARASGGTDLIQENLAQTSAAVSYRANVKTLETAQQMDSALFAMGIGER